MEAMLIHTDYSVSYTQLRRPTLLLTRGSKLYHYKTHFGAMPVFKEDPKEV